MVPVMMSMNGLGSSPRLTNTATASVIISRAVAVIMLPTSLTRFACQGSAPTTRVRCPIASNSGWPRARSAAAPAAESVRLIRAMGVGDDAKAGGGQVGGHGRAHAAETDETHARRPGHALVRAFARRGLARARC